MWPARGKAAPVGTPARPPCTTPCRRGAVLRGHAPVHASSYDSARERCGGWPPAAPLPLMNCTTPHTKCTPPPGFHMRCTTPTWEWCGSGAGVVQSAPLRRAEPWSPPPSRRLAPAASYGMTVASPCRSPRTRRARSPRSAAAKAAGSRQRFAGCRVGEYMLSGCGVYLVLIAAIKRSNE